MHASGAWIVGRAQGGTGTGIVTVGLALAVCFPALAITRSIDAAAVRALDGVLVTWLIAAAVGAYAAADAADRTRRQIGRRTRRAAAVVGVFTAVCAPTMLWLSGAAMDAGPGTTEVSAAVLIVGEIACVVGLATGLAAVRHPLLGALLVTAAVALWVSVVTRAAVGYLSSRAGGAQVEQAVAQADFLQSWLPLASGLGGLAGVLIGGRLVDSDRSASGRLMLVAATPVVFALTLYGLALLGTAGSVDGLDVPSMLWLTAGCLAGLAVHGATASLDPTGRDAVALTDLLSTTERQRGA